MKRHNEVVVGLSVVLALALVTAAALWLGQTRMGVRERVFTARFRTVGGVGVGAPVTLRGVRVGRVQAIRLAGERWVELDLKVDREVEVPSNPAVIIASASLFGEWAAAVITRDEPREDPAIEALLDEAAAIGGGVWPGATLPDVGQLTAQAGRIASDIAVLTDRVGAIFDSSTAAELRSSIRDFVDVANQLKRFTRGQLTSLDSVTSGLTTGSADLVAAARDFRTTAARFDSATADRQLTDIMTAARASSQDMRQATADFRSLMEAARSHEVSLTRVLVAADSVLSRIETGAGTLGLLASDSTLYAETSETMRTLRELLEDIQANPRRYFKFSVF